VQLHTTPSLISPHVSVPFVKYHIRRALDYALTCQTCPAHVHTVRGDCSRFQLFRLEADGTIAAVSPAEAAAAIAAAGERSTDPLIEVHVNVMKSVEAALAKQQAEYIEKLSAAGGPPAVGTQCKRKNCKNRYEDESSNNKQCQYCPGEPVFHEG
jgi:hypothetical protein